jgi:UDP-N-acetylglucosamine--N-acetylmuramyl-(pentapeptide) pyrophosphoryl-undecaprenol N-acetylglucosamine transferase
MAIGVGGFASGPALKAASSLGIPTILQEQNSYPGVTNKILSAKAKKICVAYDGLEKYFPAEKIVQTGNPIRAEILNMVRKDEKAYECFGFSKDKKTILVVGGSLGARTINQCMEKGLDRLKELNVQLLWQTGESFYKNISPELLARQNESIKIVPFIKNMNDAYSMADVIVSRAGALAIAELCVVGVPTILVPFPFAAEDHQTKNAQALVDKDAAIMIPDSQAENKLMDQLINLIQDEGKCKILGENILKLAQPDAIDMIIKEILS